jgi:hypothetical protein
MPRYVVKLPDSCPCCKKNVGCCPDLAANPPLNVTATITGCGGLDASIPLFQFTGGPSCSDGLPQYGGTHGGCDQVMNLTFCCVLDEEGNQKFLLQVQMLDNLLECTFGEVWLEAVSASCDPFEFVFVYSYFGCRCECIDAIITITI